jgi:hypothetical protein
MKPMIDTLITKSEAARRAFMSPGTLNRAIEDGAVRTAQVGGKTMVHSEDIAALAAGVPCGAIDALSISEAFTRSRETPSPH